MAKWNWVLAAALTLAGGYFAWQSGPAGLALAATPEAPGPRVTMATLPDDLISTDAPRKAAALKMLAELPYQQVGGLRHILKATENDAVKALVARRIDEITDMLATNPPNISLHVKDASLSEVIDALNDEMGTDMEHRRTSIGSYTLDVTDRPFWEVVAELDKQAPFDIEAIGSDGAAVVTPASSYSGMGRHCITGPFFMYAYTRVLPAHDANNPAIIMLCFNILIDPRMPVSDFAFAMGNDPPNCATVGPDSSGNALSSNGGGASNYGGKHSTHMGFCGRLDVHFPANPGQTITVLKADAGVTTAVPGATLEVENLAKGWEGKIGNARISLPVFGEAQNNRMPLEFHITPVDAAPLITLRLIDSRDNAGWSQTPTGTAATTGILTDQVMFPSPPYKLRVSLAKTTHVFSPHFEIKDIPMPAKP